jgi:septum formation protein
MHSRPKLILGSSSPRRKEILSALGLDYEVMTPGTDEVPRPGEPPRDYVQRNAVEKGAAVLARVKGGATAAYPHGVIVLSADTIVVLDGEILEKPMDAGHARAMLTRLSGRTHMVLSGVSLSSWGWGSPKTVDFVASTLVTIKTLTPFEIGAYISSGEPYDKAGGYAAQGIGSYMVERIEGSYPNVVGLPIAQVAEVLTRDFGYPLWSLSAEESRDEEGSRP